MKFILLLNLASTLFMTGVIWFVQVVHYPLFSRVGTETFAIYESMHATLTTLVVFPAMMLELLSAGLLLLNHKEDWRLWAGLFLLLVIWISTMFVQVPKHSELSTGFNAAVHASLVATNWIRTVAWSVRSLLMLWVVAEMIKDNG
ncbi:MAG: hypothetical protein SNJ55_02280 [Chloroherpetonaceae bacterium]